MDTTAKLVELMPVILGVVLSLVFTYAPKLQLWYSSLAANHKAGIQLLGIILISLAYFGLGCTTWAARIGIMVPCNADGIWVLLVVLAKTLMANQAAYLLTAGQREVNKAMVSDLLTAKK